MSAMRRDYPRRHVGPDGRVMVGLRVVDAVYTIGGMAIEFILEPETWPIFFAWLCAEDPRFSTRDTDGVRSDVQAVLDAMPRRQAGNPRRQAE